MISFQRLLSTRGLIFRGTLGVLGRFKHSPLSSYANGHDRLRKLLTRSSATLSQKTRLAADSQQGLASVSENDDGDLAIHYSDGTSDAFPYVFLRDSCNCESCFERISLTRLQTCNDADIKPETSEVMENGDSVLITWPDRHTSVFTSDWLKSSSFHPMVQEETYKNMLLEPPRDRLWGNEMENKVKTLDYSKVMARGDELHDFLWEIATSGVVVLADAPDKGMLEALCNRVSFLSPTHYGTTFEVYTKDKPSNFAYLAGPLPLHNDMVYNDPNPGIQIFHYIKQCEDGGANPLIDGFYAAKRLEAENPEAYRLLTTKRVIYPDRGNENFVGEFFVCSEKPPIELCNFTGKIKSIQMNLAARSFRFVPAKDIKAMYRAYAAFEEMLYDPANLIHVKSKPGEMLVIDNQRVLHGRTAFKPTPREKGTIFRHLDGGYVEWKDVMSRLRVLRQGAGTFSVPFLN